MKNMSRFKVIKKLFLVQLGKNLLVQLGKNLGTSISTIRGIGAGSLSNSSLNALVITGKILNISTSVLQASTLVAGGSCQPIKIDLNAFSPK